MARHPDYATKKQYVHPRQQRAARRHSIVQHRLVGACAVVLLLLAVANVGPVLSQLPISNIIVNGTKLITSNQVVALVREQMQTKRLYVLPQQLGVFFDTRQLRERLQQEFPFASWTVKKNVTGTVSVDVFERQPKIVWASGGQLWYVDADGVAFLPVVTSQSSVSTTSELAIVRHQIQDDGLPVVEDEVGLTMQAGLSPIPREIVSFIRTAADMFRSGRIEGLSPAISYRYHVPTHRLTMMTVAGYAVYLSSTEPLDDQVAKLKAVLAEGVGRRKNLQYIDVRFGQKVFYQ